MKIGSAFPSKYLKAADLNGKAVLCDIDTVRIEDVGTEGSPEDKPVMYFMDKKKGVILNRTNAMVIAASYGEDTDLWLGKKVEVYPDKTLFQGKMVDCIRMRAHVPAAVEGADEEPPF